jgi:hypothetical protein
MKFAIGEMTVGDILDRSLKLLLSRFGTFYLLNFLVLLPLLGFELVSPMLIEDFGLLPVALATFLLLLLLQPLATGALVRVVEQEFVDRRVGIGEALGYAGSRFGSLLGASLMTGVVVFAGALMCAVPGIIFAVWFAFVAQAVVVEKLGGGAAMARSKSLVEGYGGRVFGILLFFGLFVALGNLVSYFLNRSMPGIEYVPRGGGGEPNPLDPGVPVVNWQNYTINTCVTYLIQILSGAFLAIASTLLYFDLRIRKEGFDLEVAAQRGGDKPDLDFRS